MLLFLIGFFILLTFFLIYIQFSNDMGNIWYRNNEYWSPYGALKVIFFPLQCIEMWNPKMWDINFFIWIIIYIIITKLIFYPFPYNCNKKDEKVII
jgi:hypothetical protein